MNVGTERSDVTLRGLTAMTSLSSELRHPFGGRHSDTSPDVTSGLVSEENEGLYLAFLSYCRFIKARYTISGMKLKFNRFDF